MSPKEIAEEILEAIKVPSKYTALYYEQQKLFALARAYLELEKLKKSREVLRKALEFYGNWINSPDGIMHRSDCEAIFVHSPLEKDKNGIIVAGKKAREALKADDEIMEGK